ncbi:TauD/TfdA dioxygenase family protein [Grimontia sp. NTOU-MAR1]|uniref:TauD/TfdA dioxygenase family protein n=1 Tax=Grimontia sp. NTOU-MAR1 TaxID=3111011 RepID=UPI002DB66B3D|nr:TauD/TfdA family dioxygenase [Grimontia sp. NTOU-MAR1]WRV98453.1 TauD/TfdA family dioxygenase [Grimontia sp. NTOU-MAR1]
MISGIDLASFDDSEFTQIYQAFLKYKVIFFRDQFLSPESQLKLAARFGELEAPHPFFPHVSTQPQVSEIETTPGNPPGKSYWHTDMTWQSAPPKCSVLCAQHLPDEGGDTIWVSMEDVYASLPEKLKRQLDGKTATHAVHGFTGSRFDELDNKGESRVDNISRDIQAVHHPIVVKHPETGNPTLYLNEQFTQQVDDKGLEEEGVTLANLFIYSHNEAFQVRFRWETGSVAIWDNRCTQHFAVTDYGDKPRKLHRVVVKGSEPQAYIPK